MEPQNRNWFVVGVAVFFLASLLAPLNATIDYDWTAQPIGELAGRQNVNSWVMRAGFVGLGFCVLIDVLQDPKWRWRDWPFLLFGLANIGAGLYRNYSVDADTFLNDPMANAHGWFFIAAAFFLLIGYINRLSSDENRQKIITSCAIVWLVSCASLAVSFPNFAGLFDRLGDVGLLVWVVLNPRAAYRDKQSNPAQNAK